MVLPCSLDFCSKKRKSIYCLRIVNFKIGDGHVGDMKSHYLLLERAGSLPWRSHPLDQGTFRRVGIGAEVREKVDDFFRSVLRRFLKIV
jgi:hypothetical protein